MRQLLSAKSSQHANLSGTIWSDKKWPNIQSHTNNPSFSLLAWMFYCLHLERKLMVELKALIVCIISRSNSFYRINDRKNGWHINSKDPYLRVPITRWFLFSKENCGYNSPSLLATPWKIFKKYIYIRTTMHELSVKETFPYLV